MRPREDCLHCLAKLSKCSPRYLGCSCHWRPRGNGTAAVLPVSLSFAAQLCCPLRSRLMDAHLCLTTARACCGPMRRERWCHAVAMDPHRCGALYVVSRNVFASGTACTLPLVHCGPSFRSHILRSQQCLQRAARTEFHQHTTSCPAAIRHTGHGCPRRLRSRSRTKRPSCDACAAWSTEQR
jgi:hypothetical protein